MSYDARDAYRDAESAASYDARRFSSLRGRIGHKLDIRMVTRALQLIRSIGHLGTVRVLDLPCGTGRIAAGVPSGATFGADVSLGMSRIANSRSIYRSVLVSDANAIPLIPDKVDCILSMRFIGHIPRDVRLAVFLEFQRVAEFLALECSIVSAASKLRNSSLGRIGIRIPIRWEWHVFTRESITDELEQAGFTVRAYVPKLPLVSDSHLVIASRNR